MNKPVCTVVKCQCGHPVCRKYGLSIGMFYQGSGFEKEDAELLSRLWNEYWQKQNKCAGNQECYWGQPCIDAGKCLGRPLA